MPPHGRDDLFIRRHKRNAQHVEEMIQRQALPHATLNQYLEWLGSYLANGSVPTHYYDYSFTRRTDRAGFGFVYAAPGAEVVVFGGECGALSRSIIAAPGARVRRAGFSHTDVYCYDEAGRAVFGPSRSGMAVVPVFSDPEFDAVLTAGLRAQRDEKFADDRRWREDRYTGRGRRKRRWVEGQDSRALQALSGARFAGDVVLPSGKRVTGDEASAWGDILG